MSYEIYLHDFGGEIQTQPYEELHSLINRITNNPNDYPDIVDIEIVRVEDGESIWNWSDQSDFPSFMQQRLNDY